MNEALHKHGSTTVAHGVSIEIELHDVVGGDERRRERPRQEKVIGIGRMTRADVAETVENAKVGEDAAASHDIFDQSGIDA
jgi:hypothetical protein